MTEPKIVERTIYGFTFKINYSIAKDRDLLESARRWLSINKKEYRNYCPFILVRKSCSAICGCLYESYAVKDNKCMLSCVSIEMVTRLVEEIVSLDKDSESAIKTDAEWAEEVLDEEIIAELNA